MATNLNSSRSNVYKAGTSQDAAKSPANPKTDAKPVDPTGRPGGARDATAPPQADKTK